MKRFSAREFAFLTLPIALVAGVGFWASQRPLPEPIKKGPQLKFSVVQPTALQASDGVKTVLSVQVRDDAADKDYWIGNPKAWIEFATPQGTKSMRSDKPTTGDEMWISQEHSYADSIAMKQLPAGEITYGISGFLVETNKPRALKPPVIKGEWKVDRSQIKPFDFSMPRVPLVSLKSVTITRNDYYHIRGEAIFLLQGAAVQANPSLNFRISALRNYPDYWDTGSSYSKKVSKNISLRIVEFRLSTPNMTPPEIMKSQVKPQPLRVAGRISVGNRWPLAFEFEPINRSKVKVGQQLKFKQWPAPLPPHVKPK